MKQQAWLRLNDTLLLAALAKRCFALCAAGGRRLGDMRLGLDTQHAVARRGECVPQRTA